MAKSQPKIEDIKGLTQWINFLWLKLRDLFSDESVTTNDNYLTKIDDANKKLVKSNIKDDGTTLSYEGNINADGYKVGSGIDTKLLTDGGGTKLITDFAGADHNHDATYLGITDTAADSDKLGGELPSYYEPAFTKNTAFNKSFGTGSSDVASGDHSHIDLHSHSNKTILDDITAAFKTELKTSYDYAYEHSQDTHAPVDAEANVQSDWFEINNSYDSFIKNKPHILRYIGKLESSSDIDLRLKEEGIYTLCTGTKYLFTPNLYCGTDEYSTQLYGHLTICKPDGSGATMTYHDFRQNIVYVASAVNGIGDVLLWNNWKRLLTCKDEIAEDLEETGEFSYEIGSSYQRLSLNGNDIKGEKILIDLKKFNSQIGAKLRIVIFISPASANPDIQIIDSSSPAKQINYSLSYYTAPSSVSSNVFLIEYEIFNLIPYWLVSNKVYY